jgi:hypothetical protein
MPSQYMASLCAKGKKGGKSTQKGGKLKPKPMAILDLDNSDDDDDEGDEGGDPGEGEEVY